MNIVDSSGWLSYFADDPSAKHFLSPLQDIQALIVPAIIIYEVTKVVLRESGSDDAVQVIAAMQKGKIVDLTAKLAVDASQISLQYKLPMADSIILTTARYCNATIWTQDVHFANIPGVNYFQK